MPMLNVRLFGKFAAYTAPAFTPSGLESRKVQELFCYLLVHRTQPQHRETLAGTLWGQATDAQSRAYLRKTLWQLHAALERCPEAEPSELLCIDGEWLQINPAANLWLDVDLLERAYTTVKCLHGEEMTADAAAVVEEAVQLYRSDLLDGWYQDWCILERERLQSIYLRLLDKMMNYCQAYSRYEKGVAYGTDALRYDQTREQVHRCLMRLHFLAGDRVAALRQYERCADVLQAELAIEPTEQTTVLMMQIRNNTFAVPRHAGVQPADSTKLAELRTSVVKLQAALDVTQLSLRRLLELVEQLAT